MIIIWNRTILIFDNIGNNLSIKSIYKIWYKALNGIHVILIKHFIVNGFVGYAIFNSFLVHGNLFHKNQTLSINLSGSILINTERCEARIIMTYCMTYIHYNLLPREGRKSASSQRNHRHTCTWWIQIVCEGEGLVCFDWPLASAECSTLMGKEDRVKCHDVLCSGLGARDAASDLTSPLPFLLTLIPN